MGVPEPVRRGLVQYVCVQSIEIELTERGAGARVGSNGTALCIVTARAWMPENRGVPKISTGEAGDC